MDGREGMSLSGSSSYYLHRGISGSEPNSGSVYGSGTQPGLATPPGFKNFSNPDIQVESNVKASDVGSAHEVGPFHGVNATGMSSGGVSSGDPVKKKRGRPRKYGPGGDKMSLALSPKLVDHSQGSITPVERKNRGRPRGSGRKQRLASLGEWMNSSAGSAFTPHVIQIAVGEDIASKLLLFAQQKPRALCILAANGPVSSLTLRQLTSSGGAVTYEGRFQILCLSGSYLLSEEGGARNRTGGLSISVCSPDGHVIGGAIGGRLIAAGLVQVVACSFVYGDSKVNDNSDANGKPDQNSEVEAIVKSSTPASTGPSQNNATNSGMGIWPQSSMPGTRDPNTEIDLTRG